MFGKSSDDRWNDTIAYLDHHFPCNGLAQKLGEHVESIVPTTQRSAISKELSLGSRNDKTSSPTYAATTQQRRALRALLLCQRVYYSDLWARKTVNRVNYNPVNLLAQNWKTLSLNHWQNKTEAEVRAGIAMYAPVPGAVVADVATAAEAGPPDGLGIEIAGNLFLSRQTDCCIGAAETCYRGVMAWLLKSGIISLRWFLLDCAPNGKISCDRLFGQGVVVWSPDKLFKDNSVIPEIGRGFIAHMWLDQAGDGGWNGHWVISKGGGLICGVNNGLVNKPDEVVITRYTNGGKLRSQFEGYGGYLKEQSEADERGNTTWTAKIGKDGQKIKARANLVKFDPALLPNLM